MLPVGNIPNHYHDYYTLQKLHGWNTWYQHIDDEQGNFRQGHRSASGDRRTPLLYYATVYDGMCWCWGLGYTRKEIVYVVHGQRNAFQITVTWTCLIYTLESQSPRFHLFGWAASSSSLWGYMSKTFVTVISASQYGICTRRPLAMAVLSACIMSISLVCGQPNAKLRCTIPVRENELEETVRSDIEVLHSKKGGRASVTLEEREQRTTDWGAKMVTSFMVTRASVPKPTNAWSLK